MLFHAVPQGVAGKRWRRSSARVRCADIFESASAWIVEGIEMRLLLLAGGFKPFLAAGRLTNVVNRDCGMGVVTQLRATPGAGLLAGAVGAVIAWTSNAAPNRPDRTIRHGLSNIY
jgi:hypothetical protein